jgi:hypothetical protein
LWIALYPLEKAYENLELRLWIGCTPVEWSARRGPGRACAAAAKRSSRASDFLIASRAVQ